MKNDREQVPLVLTNLHTQNLPIRSRIIRITDQWMQSYRRGARPRNSTLYLPFDRII